MRTQKQVEELLSTIKTAPLDEAKEIAAKLDTAAARQRAWAWELSAVADSYRMRNGRKDRQAEYDKKEAMDALNEASDLAERVRWILARRILDEIAAVCGMSDL